MDSHRYTEVEWSPEKNQKEKYFSHDVEEEWINVVVEGLVVQKQL
jgi:hypothetical protein